MLSGEHKREAFLNLTPFGQMPAMKDDNCLIAHSHACLTYLTRKLGELAWLPMDTQAIAKVAEWMSKCANKLHQRPRMAAAIFRRPNAIFVSDEEISA